MINIKKYLKYIGNVVTIVSIVFVVYAVFKLDIEFEKLANPRAILILIIGALGVTFTVNLLSYAWKNSLDYLSHKKNKFVEVSSVYGKANLGKYLPGNVMHYVERNLFATKIGLEQLDLAISSIIEVVGIIIVALMFSFVCARKEFFKAINEYMKKEYIVIFAILLLIIAFLVVFVYIRSSKIRNMCSRLMNLKFIAVFIYNLVIYAVVLGILGGILVLIYQFIFDGGLNPNQIAMVITYYMLAWVVGFVVPGAPGGIGVREAVLVLLLGPLVGKEVTLSAALIHRLVSIIGDTIEYVIAVKTGKSCSKEKSYEKK